VYDQDLDGILLRGTVLAHHAALFAVARAPPAMQV
jgi:hypothetical protein